MKLRDVLYLVIIVGILAWWFFTPPPDPEIVEIPVEIPVEVEVPVVEKVFDTIYQPIPVASKADEELLKKYEALKDENEKIKLVENLARARTYREVFDDSIQTITVESSVTGKLTSQSVSYKTKPREISTVVKETVPVEMPKSKMHLLGGIETGVPTDMTNPGAVIKGTMFLESKKGTIFSLGYDTEGRVWGGVIIKIF